MRSRCRECRRDALSWLPFSKEQPRTVGDKLDETIDRIESIALGLECEEA